MLAQASADDPLLYSAELHGVVHGDSFAVSANALRPSNMIRSRFPGLGLWLALLFPTLCPGSWAQDTTPADSETPAAGALMAEIAEQELQRLASHEGTLRSREDLMLRNVSRYWARYEAG